MQKMKRKLQRQQAEDNDSSDDDNDEVVLPFWSFFVGVSPIERAFSVLFLSSSPPRPALLPAWPPLFSQTAKMKRKIRRQEEEDAERSDSEEV